MKSNYAGEAIVLSPKKGLLSIKLPKKTVAQAFKKLQKRGAVVRITHQDESGDTSVLFKTGSLKKVEKIVETLKAEYFKEKTKSKDKNKDKKKT